jgi:hypothetical protein
VIELLFIPWKPLSLVNAPLMLTLVDIIRVYGITISAGTHVNADILPLFAGEIR